MESRFQALAEDAAARWEVPALAVGVLAGGRSWELAVGCEPGTRFRIASVTKPMTATLALELLDPDAGAGVWADDVLIRHLLAHTSGYSCENGDLARFGDGDDALAQAVAELPAVPRLVGGEQAWSYANTGYWLAGHLAAECAGSTYEDALTRHVLAPAGLEATGFDEPDVAGSGPGATSDPYPRARRPSGGLVSNVGDLLRFASHHLADERSRLMRVVHGKPAGGVYGLGLSGERVGGVEVWGHPGSYGGFQSSLLVVPERGAAFVGLTSSGRGAQALHELEDAWFESVLGARRRRPETFPLDADALAGFVGTYGIDDITALVATGEGGLVVDVSAGEEQERATARPIGPRTFEVTSGDEVGYRFDFPLDGFVRLGSRLMPRLA
jgi:CubicO group peptidase (beta-lactamase class C family)